MKTRKPILLFTAAALWALMMVPVPACAQFGDLFGRHHKSAASGNVPTNGGTTLPPYAGPKKRLAVEALEVKVGPAAGPDSGAGPSQPGMAPDGSQNTAPTESPISIAPPTDFGTGLTEMLTTELSKTGRFILLERAALGDVTGEQALDSGPGFDPAGAARPGSLLGAQVLIRGAITSYSYTSSGTDSQGLAGALGNTFGNAVGGALSTCKASVTLDLRLIDVSTGQVIDSVDATGKSSSTAYRLDLTASSADVGTSAFNNSPLGLAVRRAISGAVYQICTDQKLGDQPWEAQIADLDAGGGMVTLYLDCGSDAGIMPGDILTVFRPGRPIVSPETRLVIGRTKDTEEGHCRVDSVTPDMATAAVLDGSGFAIADIVRSEPKVAAPASGQ